MDSYHLITVSVIAVLVLLAACAYFITLLGQEKDDDIDWEDGE